MKKIFLFIFTILFLQTNAQFMMATTQKSSDFHIIDPSNPFLRPWNTPFQTPPFSEIRPEHYLPATQACIKEAENEIQEIIKTPAMPTFENTIVALDRAGERLNRVTGVFFNLLECDATTEMQELSLEIQPLLTEYSSNLYLNQDLFDRVKYVFDNEYNQLNTAQQMLLKKTYDAFVDNGANLSPKDKARFKDLQMELSKYTLMFGQNALAATNSYTMLITDKNELAGLPESELAIAAQKAKDQHQKGYLFDLSQPSVTATLKYADNRKLREEMFRHSCNKAYDGNNSNTHVIVKILNCRYEIAKLLGYDNYAEYALHNRMAKNSTTVYDFLNQLQEASKVVAERDVQDLNDFAKTLGFEGDIQRWDFAYYSEKQLNDLYKLNTEMLKPYFKLENVIQGVFSLAKNLYGLSFIEANDIDVYHPDVTAYKVYRGDKFMAVLYLDFHPRATKRSGAWMTAFREQYVNAKQQDVRPLISLVMNFTPSTKKNPSLLSFYEVTTFLHEFGHALHGMMSDVPYLSISGTNTPRDFVELPSQLNENWATEYEFLKTFAHHYKTGELIPTEYIEQLKKVSQFQSGYSSMRQLSFGYLDMMWHSINPTDLKASDILKAEHRIMDNMDVLPIVPEACMSTSFTHIFAGGYAAGYYGYKWAEMLEADAFSLFQETGVMNKETANHYVNTILSKGSSEPAMDMYVKFRGREPNIDALIKKCHLRAINPIKRVKTN